jgi:hypothetical protein
MAYTVVMTAPAFFCTMDMSCPAKFNNVRDWTKHEKDQHPENFNANLCFKCLRVFPTEGVLESHWKVNHDKENTGLHFTLGGCYIMGSKNDMWFWCGFCKNVRARWHQVPYMEDYYMHVKQHIEGVSIHSVGHKLTIGDWYFLPAVE